LSVNSCGRSLDIQALTLGRAQEGNLGVLSLVHPRVVRHNGLMPRRPVNRHTAYHAHVYFDASTVAQARAVCEEAGRLFGVAVGRVHEKLVGPHPRWSCQLAFSAAEFDLIVPWLDEHRGSLDVFVHGLSGDELRDHTEYAYWLGNDRPLDLRQFQKS
jgi:DOPA 4,5-dioxygenase